MVSVIPLSQCYSSVLPSRSLPHKKPSLTRGPQLVVTLADHQHCEGAHLCDQLLSINSQIWNGRWKGMYISCLDQTARHLGVAGALPWGLR